MNCGTLSAAKRTALGQLPPPALHILERRGTYTHPLKTQCGGLMIAL